MSFSPGGGDSLSGSSDVALNNISDNELLIYDSNIQKWKNKTGVTDTYLLSRSNHTGSQPASSISDFTTAVRSTHATIRNATANTTLAATDEYLRMNSSSSTIVTVPTNASVSFAVGYVVSVRRVGTGSVSIAPASGVVLNGTISGVPQNGSYFLIKVATDEWDIEGGTA